jgi:hypothetical protein
MVFLNFSDSARSLSVPFPVAGVYREMLDDDARGPSPLEITVQSPGEFHSVSIPSNYGQIFVMPAVTPLPQ